MKTKLLTLITLLLCVFQVNAQQGKPSVKVFSNFNYDMNPEEGETEFKEFELKRAYLGYSYSMDENFSTKITFDVGSNDGGSAYTAFLKIAASPLTSIIYSLFDFDSHLLRDWDGEIKILSKRTKDGIK